MLIFLVTSTAVLAGCQLSSPDAPPPSYRIELHEPSLGEGKKLVVNPGAEFVVSVRISNLAKQGLPDVIFARFTRGNAMAGEFLARPREGNNREVEYKTRVAAPKKPGNYKLIVAPSSFSESMPGAPPKDKYPSFDVVVK